MSTSRRRQQSLASHSGYEASVGDDVGCRLPDENSRELSRLKAAVTAADEALETTRRRSEMIRRVFDDQLADHDDRYRQARKRASTHLL